MLVHIFHQLKSGLHFGLKAKRLKNLPSGWLKAVLEEMLDKNRVYDDFNAIEQLRKLLLRNRSEISVTDLGAGARNKTNRSIRSIAKTALSSPWQGQALYRLSRKLQVENTIELGTSLGISTAYLALANEGTNVISFEGSPEIARIARQHFSLLGLTNIVLVTGHFDDTLPPVLEKSGHVNLAFIDGNHQRDATLRYFKLLLPKTSEDSVLIFDDIHWSPGMEKAWGEIKTHPHVTATADLYAFGLVFFHPKAKGHYRVVAL